MVLERCTAMSRGRRNPQPGCPEDPDDVASADEPHPERLKGRVEVGRHVVVVEVETPLRDASRARDRVEFDEGGVRDHMSPDAPVAKPERGVNEDRHPPTLSPAA